MDYQITPSAFNWGAQPSGSNFGMPNLAPAPVDYSSYLAPDSGASPGLGFSNPSAPNTSVAGFSAPTANAPAYSSPVGPIAPVGTGTGATANAGEQGWFGRNMDNGNIMDVAKILGGFGQVWGGIQANNIARDTLKFQKKSYNTNLANQIKTYNLALDDRIRARYAQNERSSAEADQTIAANQL